MKKENRIATSEADGFPSWLIIVDKHASNKFTKNHVKLLTLYKFSPQTTALYNLGECRNYQPECLKAIKNADKNSEAVR